MASCNNSSNIAGNTIINSLQAVGSRLITVLPNTNSVKGGCQSGLTAGDVLRYDVISVPNLYVKAQADDPANSEVVGIVESVTDANVTLVMAGQIEFPAGAFHSIDPDGPGGPLGSTGAAGGNDIYFLSAATAGNLQNLAPDQETQIIKPVLQMADNDDFNGIVQNYIGYQVGGNVVANPEELNSRVGETRTYLDGSIMSAGFHRADGSELSIADYPEWYSIFGTRFGHVVEITLPDSGTQLPASVGGKIANQYRNQENFVSGVIEYISPSKIRVTVDGSQTNVFQTSLNLIIQGRNYGDPENATIVSSFVPIISSKEIAFDVRNSNGGLMNHKYFWAIAVQNTFGVTIPSRIRVKDLEVTNKLHIGSEDAGIDVLDAGKALNNIFTDSASFASKLNASSQLVDDEANKTVRS